MLALTSPRWAELSQAYGSAADVPRLLEAVAESGLDDARAELWFALWRMLHRPDEVFTASYAAVPHLLAATATFGERERLQALHLATRIEISRRAPASAPMPEDLLAAYAEAIERLPLRVAELTAAPWTEEVARICAAALLVGKRQPALALLLLDDDAGPAS
jgi:hypothetical protein